MPVILFAALALLTLGSALVVVMAENIVRAAVGLFLTLLGVAGLYLSLEAEFLAAVQLVVYVGGTLILMIFGIMLTRRGPQVRWGPQPWELLWALILGGAFFAGLLAWIHHVTWPLNPNPSPIFSVHDLGVALLDPAGYLAPFELISALLLAVMIGAAYLAKRRREPCLEKP